MLPALLAILGGALLWAACRTMRKARRTLHEAIAFALFLAAVVAICGAVVTQAGASPWGGPPEPSSDASAPR